jgi:hypothetical protein
MALSKIGALSVDLTDNYAFTGTVSGAGKIRQVLSTTYNTQTSITATSFTLLSGFSVSITPSSTSSKILVEVSSAFEQTGNSEGFATIYRDSTNLSPQQRFARNYGHDAHSNVSGISMSFLDSPSSTSSLSYAVYGRVASGTATFNPAIMSSTITVMEIL